MRFPLQLVRFGLWSLDYIECLDSDVIGVMIRYVIRTYFQNQYF